MQTFNKFFLALAFLGGSAAAQAAESNELARPPLNKGGERVETVGRRNAGVVWDRGLSQQVTYNGMPVAQKNLSGRFDLDKNDLQHTTPALFSRAAVVGPQDWNPVMQKLI